MVAPLWILTVYYIMALAGVPLVVFVMLKTERDRINRIDPPLIVSARRFVFGTLGLSLAWTIIDRASQLSLILLVILALILLVINAFALHYRVPPSNHQHGRGIVPEFVRRWWPRNGH